MYKLQAKTARDKDRRSYPRLEAEARGRPHATSVGCAGSEVVWVVAICVWAVLVSAKVSELVTNIAGLGVREVHASWVHLHRSMRNLVPFCCEIDQRMSTLKVTSFRIAIRFGRKSVDKDN